MRARLPQIVEENPGWENEVFRKIENPGPL